MRNLMHIINCKCRIRYVLVLGLRGDGVESSMLPIQSPCTVAQSVWEGRVQTPKTVNAFRQVDLHPTVAAMLRDFIGDRKQGFLFRTRTGTPFLQSNFLRSSLYPILEELGIEKQGFHGFRRFRVTHLESSCVPPALVKYWTGHAKSSDGEVVRQTVTDRYIKMAKDTKFRAEVAERIGLGFELPKAETVEVVPSVPNVPISRNGGHCKHLKNREKIGSPG